MIKYRFFERLLTFNFTLTTFLVMLSVFLRLLSPVTADLSFIVLAMLALIGRRQIIIAFALSWLFIMANPSLVPDTSFGIIGRFLVIFAGAISVFFRSNREIWQSCRVFNLTTLIFALFIFGHSILISSHPDVSLLKLASWLMTFLALLHAWLGLTSTVRSILATQLFFWAFVVLVVFSLPLLNTSEGYLINDTGFQGVLNHPQAFGSTIAILCIWSLGRLLHVSKFLYLEIGGFLILAFLIFKTEARVAGLSVFFAVLAAVLITRLTLKKQNFMVTWQPKSFRVTILSALILVIAILPIGLVDNFISKSGRAQADGLLSAFESSRGILYLPMLDNISSDPWRGVGYGIPSNVNSLSIHRNEFSGLPIGVSVEKGITPLAILEELGLWGFFIFLIWLLIAIRHVIKAGFLSITLFFVIFFLNLGEATFFSPGGMGMLMLLVFTYVVVNGVCVKPFLSKDIKG